MFIIRAETAGDAAGIDSLNDLGFGADRLSRTVWKLRLGPVADGLAFVAADTVDRRLLATLRFWPVEIGGDGRAVLLGPLAVCPRLHGQGIGRALVSHGIQAARDRGWEFCLVSGEPDYYRPFGFQAAGPYGFEMPGPVRAGWLQVRELRVGALSALPPAPTRRLQAWRCHRPGTPVERISHHRHAPHGAGEISGLNRVSANPNPGVQP